MKKVIEYKKSVAEIITKRKVVSTNLVMYVLRPSLQTFVGLD